MCASARACGVRACMREAKEHSARQAGNASVVHHRHHRHHRPTTATTILKRTKIASLPIKCGHVPFPTSYQDVPAIPSIPHCVWPKLRQVQIEDLARSSHIHSIFYCSLRKMVSAFHPFCFKRTGLFGQQDLGPHCLVRRSTRTLRLPLQCRLQLLVFNTLHARKEGM